MLIVAAATACLPMAPACPQQVAPGRADGFALTGTPVQGGIVSGQAPKGTMSLQFDGKPVVMDADGRFLIGFDRDASPAARLQARLPNGRTIDRNLNVAPRDWRIEKIDAPLRPTKDNDAFLAIRRPELDAITAARSVVTDADGWRQSFVWPRVGRISGLFGSQRVYQGVPGAYHSGVDVAGATGEPVVAPADGVVILAASDTPFTLEGHLLMIDHGHGLNSAFLHLSRIDVRVGEHVRQGQRIGAIGATGRATGPHLHWGMKWNDARIDPMLVAGPMPNGR